MKKLYCLILVAIIASCHYPFVKIVSDERKCFSKKELNTLMDDYTADTPDAKTARFGVRPIVKSKNTCIGLYGYRFLSLRGGKLICKALKFEDSLYCYRPDTDSVLNRLAFEKFEQQYKHLFTQEEFERLKASYLRGFEIQARFF